MVEITESILYQLEEKLAACLNEHADMGDITQRKDGTWTAVVHYDGDDNEGHRGEVEFSFEVYGQSKVVNDFILLSFYGSNPFNPNIVIG